MNTTRILISSELEAYREAFAEVFKEIYPEMVVLVAEPDDLDRKVQRSHPTLVVCSRATALVKSSVSVWVELYPDDGSLSVVSVSGKRRVVESMNLRELLDLANQAQARS